MKKNSFAFLLAAFLLLSLISKGQSLSPYSEISVLTCAPGDELYSTFGHSALRIKDPVLRLDKVYNYGTFNFEDEGFYLKFVRGKLDYMLSVSSYSNFVGSYKYEKRAVYEQILDLNLAQKNTVFKAIEYNALPENKYYRYDFLDDNCATRVLKILKDALADSICLPEKMEFEKKTYREMLQAYLKNKNWERFGINLALGRPTDKAVGVVRAAFLPDFLAEIIDKSHVQTANEKVPLVKQKKVIYLPAGKKERKASFLTPQKIFFLLLLIIIFVSFIEIRQKKNFLILDKTIFFIFGFVGLNILLLWFGTEHTSVVNNLNILWASPLFFIAAFLLKAHNKRYVKIFFFAYASILLLSLITDVFIMPLFDKAVLPLLLILFIRSLLLSRISRRSQK